MSYRVGVFVCTYTFSGYRFGGIRSQDGLGIIFLLNGKFINRWHYPNDVALYKERRIT